MLFIIDAQLPPALTLFFTARGQEAVAVRDPGLRDADDREIWKKTGEMQAIVVIKDEDFVHFVTLREA
jgi:predicted nuclease of predicted toxin-antitoxin system